MPNNKVSNSTKKNKENIITGNNASKNLMNKLHNAIDIINDLDTIDNLETENVDYNLENTDMNDSNMDDKKVKDDGRFITIFNKLTINIHNITVELRKLKLEMKRLSKSHNQEIKKTAYMKNNNREKKKTGFMKEQKIPDKLAKYLNLDKETTMIRNNVIKMIYNKITSDSLHDPKDKRIFRPDDKLIKLFNLDKKTVMETTDPKDENGFSFFTLQKHLARVYREEENKLNVDKPIKDQKKNKKLKTKKNNKSEKKDKKDKKVRKTKIEIKDLDTE